MSDQADYRYQAQQYWDSARRRVFWTRLGAAIKRQETRLIDFDKITQRLHLRQPRYRGKMDVPLNKIVGSVGRYQDFTSTFLPTTAQMRERWKNVATLYLDPRQSPPPIECYKIGDNFFVRDGNHRVSVAHQLDFADIEAYVWEYPVPLAGLPQNADIDTLLIEYERQDFLQTTRLHELRPQHDIRCTTPGGYTDLLRQIAHYQEVISAIDGENVSYEAAVTAWYDLLYETVVQIIEEMGMLQTFPDRTPADAFIWLTRYHHELEERYGKGVRLTQAVRKLENEHQPMLRKLVKGVRKRLPGSEEALD